jgi:hypothetical protein
MAQAAFGSRFCAGSHISRAAQNPEFAPGRRERHGQTYNRLFKQIKQLGRFDEWFRREVAIARPPSTEDEIQR